LAVLLSSPTARLPAGSSGVLSRQLFGFDLVRQLVHFLRIDTWLETVDEDADPEPRGLCGLFGQSQSGSQGFVHHALEALAAPSHQALKPISDVGVQGKSRAYNGIVMLSKVEVKMQSLAVAAVSSTLARATGR
jgi:hypothetical protein